MNNNPSNARKQVAAVVFKHLTHNGLNSESEISSLDLDSVAELTLSKKLIKRFDIAIRKPLSSFDTAEDLIDHVTKVVVLTQNVRSFFADGWRSSIKSYRFSGTNLIEEINRQNPKRVLDLGCGENYFKNKIQNLVGLDIVNPNADIVCDFLDFDPGMAYFDIILALGSINFGSSDNVLEMLCHAKQLLSNKGKLYMRVNPGLRWPQRPDLVIYPWNHENIFTNGKIAGLSVLGTIQDDPGPHGMRLVFIYTHLENV